VWCEDGGYFHLTKLTRRASICGDNGEKNEVTGDANKEEGHTSSTALLLPLYLPQ